jgi:hypothetical protein
MLKILYFISIVLVLFYFAYYLIFVDDYSKFIITDELKDSSGQFFNIFLLFYLYLSLILFGLYIMNSD